MPAKLMPGTPSISNGRMMPCQWIEVGKRIRLWTRIVTSSPSRQCSVGAGIDPLIVVAMRAAPVKLTGVSSTYRSNEVPRSTGAVPSAVLERVPCAAAGRLASHGAAPSSTPPAARPCTKRRRAGRTAWKEGGIRWVLRR